MMEDNPDPYTHYSNGQEQDDFLNSIDLDKILIVLKKSIPWLFLIFILTCSSAYLYVRYTKPLYESGSILKLDIQNEASIIGISNPLENPAIAGLSGEIELLKSDLFFDHVVKAINYDVSYYYYGQILTEERYKNSPFIVSHKLKTNLFYDKPIDIDIIDNETFTISYFFEGTSYNTVHKFGSEIQNGFFNLLIEKTPAFTNSNGLGKYYFTINSAVALNNYFRENIIVEPLNFNAKTIKISLRDHNKFKARAFVTAIDTIYLAYTKEHKNKAIEQKIDFLNTQLEETNLRLENYEDYFENFTITHRTTSLEKDLGVTISRLEALDTQYVALKTNLSHLELIITQIQARQAMIIGPLTISSLPRSLAESLNKYNELRSERETKLASNKENTFVIQRIDQKLSSVEGEIRKLFNEYKGILEDQIETVDSRRGVLENSFVQLPSRGTEFRKNRRFYNLLDETYLQLVKSKSELEIARAGTVTNFVVLSPASDPIAPVEPQKLLIYALGVVAGIVLAVFFVLIRYLLHNKINGIKEIERLVRAPILGSIPRYNGNDTMVTRLVIDQNPKSGISEALRAIRTNMEFLIPNKQKRIISITSTISGEGKTFISVNLGAILALSNKKVVIVDLDMRKPKVHLTFGDDKGDGGVSTILIGKNPLENSVRETEIDGLSYITAGPTPPNPSELLLGKEFDTFLDDLKKKFDVIILDTPPVGLVTDGVLAMQKSDLSIYVFRADYSHKSFVNSLNNLVKTNQFQNLCVLINSVKYAKGYGYGNGYGYGAGYYDDSETKNGKLFKFPKSLSLNK